jgi:DNA repair protein RecO (recombination protein O)
MAQYTTEAIVLGVRNWGDADKMLTLFSREHGRIKAAAFGCRRPKSPLAGGMQMFNHLDLQLTEGERIDTVKQYTLHHHFKRLSEDLTTMAYGSFVAELTSEFAPEREPQPAVFGCMLDIFTAFETRNPRITALAGAYQLLEFSGLQLRYDHCVHCGRSIEGDACISMDDGGVLCADCGGTPCISLPGGVRELILHLISLDWKDVSPFMVHREELLLAEHLLLKYLQGILGKPLKSLAFINQLAAIRD